MIRIQNQNELMPGPHPLLVVVAVCLIKTASGFANGKVSPACGDMTPQHGHDSSSKPAPYNITLDKPTFSPGDHITVTLRVVPTYGSISFKGFLIEARDAGNPDGLAVGSFSLLNPSESQLLHCGHTQGSAVSHTSKSKKTEIQAVWEAPKNPPSDVQFMATVVQKYKVYWVQIPGPVVSLNGATGVPPPNPTTTTTAVTTTLSALTRPFSSEGCGRSKSCLRDPVGCDPGRDPLCFFLSFTPEERTVLFELSGPADGYLSFALSLDKWMGNDDVYLCVRDGDSVDINAAYVSGRAHPELASENVLSDTAWQLADGVIQCRFRRDILLPRQIESRFSLDQSYFLFIAHGRAEDGVFMLVAWMTTVTTGVIIARYFKHDCPETRLFGRRLWFQVHRALMTLTVLLTCVGFSLPFIYRGGWSRHAGSHPYLGCTVMALSFIQPIMALLRPATDSSRRYIFNWMHLGTGTIARVLAVVAIFLGIQQQALLLPGPWSTGVLAGCVVWGVLVDLLLEFHSKVVIVTGRTLAEDEEKILGTHSDSERQRKVSRFKKIVLAVFLVGNVGFLSVLLNTIRNV
ncbi:putative ferric-chelate reductase 1 isoform X3 [Oncorhynchus masou masou]|uniref:putative ferric-chelate reductase 1 isoform X3 n=1 Tax=Oncorhynchus masou masou TaxID=90313 RepID=UPI003182D467